MAAKVHLQNVVDALEIQFDEHPSFLDLDSGAVYMVELDVLREIEEDQTREEPDEDDPEAKMAYRILFSGRCQRLPGKHDINEWDIMLDFAKSVKSTVVRGELLEALDGRGAFRLFKSAVHRHQVEKAWFAFKSQELREIAIEFCEENGLDWE